MQDEAASHPMIYIILAFAAEDARRSLNRDRAKAGLRLASGKPPAPLCQRHLLVGLQDTVDRVESRMLRSTQ